MAYNKITYGGRTLIDLTSDTVDAEHLAKGYIAHDKGGNSIVGTMESGGSATNKISFVKQVEVHNTTGTTASILLVPSSEIIDFGIDVSDVDSFLQTHYVTIEAQLLSEHTTAQMVYCRRTTDFIQISEIGATTNPYRAAFSFVHTSSSASTVGNDVLNKPTNNPLDIKNMSTNSMYMTQDGIYARTSREGSGYSFSGVYRITLTVWDR